MKKNTVCKVKGFLSNTILILLTCAVIVLLIFVVQSKITGKAPSIGGYQMYIVMSGSMNPTIKTGSLVIVKPAGPKEIKAQDVITFRGKQDGENTTTHRVIDIYEKDGLFFKTKGDANEVEDPMPVSANHLIGKVVFTIPYIGYAFYFARSRGGILILLATWTLFLAVELAKIIVSERKGDKNKSERKINEGEITKEEA
ncbi:signal peptidase I [Tepidanaerobacter syntrophicus]|uniref:Signal peptidase I n=1 Tax=Tepidanaerobacter syntrophicus TaxID=224999 RepID=A0A0U9HFP7_9FIRM|nr:signal peptidase I [Tepidanaerobacter syntrophicus]GAQ25517.1 signal peptidase, endoplasmic reticulum-type [Tepidanaerobacter syntrophicus]